MIAAMIPARLGSQRLHQKNLALLAGVPLLTRAIRRCKAAGCFDGIWVNGDAPQFREIAGEEGVQFHQRPAQLAGESATSEQYTAEFLEAHDCDFLVQVHSIGPLVPPGRIAAFVEELRKDQADVLLACIHDQIECAYEGRPVNFTFQAKTNSQDLTPIQRITWTLTGWRRVTYLAAFRAGRCATYAGRAGFFPVSPVEGHVIKTAADLNMAEALWRIAPAE